MNSFIKLTSLVVFAFSISAQAANHSVEVINSALNSMENEIGRQLTNEEREQMGNALLSMTEVSPLQKISTSVADESFSFVCSTAQIAPGGGKGFYGTCLGQDLALYHFGLGQLDSFGLALTISIGVMRITGPAAREIKENVRALPGGALFDKLTGVSSSTHYFAGGDLGYFEDRRGSTLAMGNFGVGFSINGGGFVGIPLFVALMRIGGAPPKLTYQYPQRKGKDILL